MNTPVLPLPPPITRRIASAFYDALLLIAMWMAGALLSTMLLTLAGLKPEPGPMRGFYFLVGFAYFGACWVYGGQTLGMRVWRLTARRSDGRPLNWVTAGLRYALAYLSWLSVIGIVWAVFDARKRALHEVLTGTEMVYTPKQ